MMKATATATAAKATEAKATATATKEARAEKAKCANDNKKKKEKEVIECSIRELLENMVDKITRDEDYKMCEDLITEFKLDKNIDIMRKCYKEFCLISKKFPPQKNEYKFIYGKLGEKALISMLENIGINITDLDANHKIGSEYKNDIQIEDIKFSIKVKLNKGGDVIMINCKSKGNHTLDINTIVVVINERKIYFIPKTFNTDDYIKSDSGSISYKSKLFTHINKKHPELIYTFPELTSDELDIIKGVREVDIYNELYINYIIE